MAKGKSNTGLNRRWFADMSGWGVSFQVGSGEPTKGKRSLPVAPDSKFLATSLSIGSALHQTVYSFNPLSVITPGTGSSQRIGAGIRLKGLSFKFNIMSNNTFTNQGVWRILLVASTYQGGLPNFGAVLNTGHLFYATTGLDFTAAHVDSRIAKVVCDELVHVVPTISGSFAFMNGFIDCSVDIPYEYQTTSSYGVNSNLYLVVIPSLAYGTTGSTVCGSITGESLICWAD
jgi:hypothetical protein